MTNLTGLTAEIVSAYVSANKLSPADLSGFISSVHDALAAIGQPSAPLTDDITPKPTAAQIRKSITPDALISFLDGRSYKTLKRHLTSHGLTLSDYKARFGLPHDYPTVAPSYGAARSAMALAIGLGKKSRRSDQATVAAEAEVDLPSEEADQPPPAKRTRKKLHLPFAE